MHHSHVLNGFPLIQLEFPCFSLQSYVSLWNFLSNIWKQVNDWEGEERNGKLTNNLFHLCRICSRKFYFFDREKRDLLLWYSITCFSLDSLKFSSQVFEQKLFSGHSVFRLRRLYRCLYPWLPSLSVSWVSVAFDTFLYFFHHHPSLSSVTGRLYFCHRTTFLYTLILCQRSSSSSFLLLKMISCCCFFFQEKNYIIQRFFFLAFWVQIP